jgi:hypothetical protein
MMTSSLDGKKGDIVLLGKERDGQLFPGDAMLILSNEMKNMESEVYVVIKLKECNKETVLPPNSERVTDSYYFPFFSFQTIKKSRIMQIISQCEAEVMKGIHMRGLQSLLT